jgi:ECF sigma factor
MDRGEMTELLGRALDGDESAALKLWPLVQKALQPSRFGNNARHHAVDFDAALNYAYLTFLVKGRNGTIEVANSHELRQFLHHVLSGNLIDQIKACGRRKRNPRPNPGGPTDLETSPTGGPDPEMVVLLREQYDRILQRLEREKLKYRRIAEMLVEGFIRTEIATRLEISNAQVTRSCDAIKCLIEDMAQSGEAGRTPRATSRVEEPSLP